LACVTARSASTATGSWRSLREKLLDALDPVLHRFFDTKGIGEDYDELSKAHDDTKQLSNKAGEFFRSLIPDGIRKPEIEGVPDVGSANWIMMLEHTQAFKLLQDEVRGLSRKEYRDQKKEILKDSIHGRERVGIHGELQETELTDGDVEQMIMNVHGQAGNNNLIYERVTNRINRKRNTNYAEASLVIQDVESGITLDLNALLPSDYKFVPRLMDKELFKNDPESSSTGISYGQDEIADLKDYEMGRSEPEGFAVRPFYKNVDYGDLRETGGVLSLLHEIAHSWQSKYYHITERGKIGFEGLYRTVIDLISRLDLPKDHTQYEEPEKIWKKLEEAGIECLDKDGIKIPVDQEGVINIPNTYFNLVKSVEIISQYDDGTEQQKEELRNLTTDWRSQIRFYPIRSDALQKAMDTYVSEERDAWAHAIRVVRFLRRNGLNLEPELKDPQDFKKVIDPCLDSYQDDLDNKILNMKPGYRFKKSSNSLS
jgi:CRISPR/Cas system CSM-associated protein Csm2 small subunit